VLKKALHKQDSSKSTQASNGFTLMELLVGMTIFIVIMASVTLMFNAVVRTSKIGYQNQIAYQVVRGVFDTIEQDVTRTFTSRETGHKNTFYGSPYGITFIGMVDLEDTGDFNMARITYVIYTNSLNSDTNTLFRQGYESVGDDATDPTQRQTYSLLRYVEPGVDNLESFPINWEDDIVDDTLGVYNLRTSEIDPIVAGFANCDGSIQCTEALERSIKCELWLRMLSGDDRVPRFWGNGSSVREVGIITDNLDPADYVLAENILHIERLAGYSPEDYTTYDKWDDTVYPLIDNGAVDIALIDLDEVLIDPVTLLATDYQHFRDYRTAIGASVQAQDMVRDYVFSFKGKVESIQGTTKFNLEGNDTGINDSILTSRDFAFWNDRRNLEFTEGVSIAAAAATADPLFTEDVISTESDIMDPDLPESVQLQITLFYPSPYAGAPDFEKTFTQQFDIPTALRREQESLDTKLQRDIE